MTPELFAKYFGSGCHDADQFLVGLPRAGSTLLEQIPASHSQVDGTQELPNIGALAFKLMAVERCLMHPNTYCLADGLISKNSKSLVNNFWPIPAYIVVMRLFLSTKCRITSATSD